MDTLTQYVDWAATKLGLTYGTSGAEVLPGLFIGSLATATSDFVNINNIDVIINLSGKGYDSYVPGAKIPRPMFTICMGDVTVTPETLDKVITDFAAGVDAIKLSRGKKKRVLVHCMAGVNRSATLIGFYLISLGMSYNDTIDKLAAANNQRNMPLLTNASFKYLLQMYSAMKNKLPC